VRHRPAGLAGRYRKSSTLPVRNDRPSSCPSVVRAAIKHYHAALPSKAKGRNLDLAVPEIKRLFQGARRKAREAGRKTNKATPWLEEDFAAREDLATRASGGCRECHSL
jgi:hypothetical protein